MYKCFKPLNLQFFLKHDLENCMGVERLRKQHFSLLLAEHYLFIFHNSHLNICLYFNRMYTDIPVASASYFLFFFLSLQYKLFVFQTILLISPKQQQFSFAPQNRSKGLNQSHTCAALSTLCFSNASFQLVLVSKYKV